MIGSYAERCVGPGGRLFRRTPQGVCVTPSSGRDTRAGSLCHSGCERWRRGGGDALLSTSEVQCVLFLAVLFCARALLSEPWGASALNPRDITHPDSTCAADSCASTEVCTCGQVPATGAASPPVPFHLRSKGAGCALTTPPSPHCFVSLFQCGSAASGVEHPPAGAEDVGGPHAAPGRAGRTIAFLRGAPSRHHPTPGIVSVASRIQSPARRPSRHPSPPLVCHLRRVSWFLFPPPAGVLPGLASPPRQPTPTSRPVLPLTSGPTPVGEQPSRAGAGRPALFRTRTACRAANARSPHPLLRVRLSDLLVDVLARREAHAGRGPPAELTRICGTRACPPRGETHPNRRLHRRGGGGRTSTPPCRLFAQYTPTLGCVTCASRLGYKNCSVGRCWLSRRRTPTSVC